MTTVNSAASLMRQPDPARKRGIWRAGAALASLSLAAACSTLNEDREQLAAVSREQLVASYERAELLEARIAELETENTRLGEQLAALESAKAQAAADTAQKTVDEAKVASAPPTVPAPQAKRGAIVDSAVAGEALAGGPAPVDPAPRLVQPSFATNEERIFENEAASGAIKTESVLYGVHLASYRRAEEARSGWRKLQRENPNELGLLEPRVEAVTVEGKGAFLRLIGGGFSDQETAAALCENLKAKGVYCAVSGFAGDKLSSVAGG